MRNFSHTLSFVVALVIKIDHKDKIIQKIFNRPGVAGAVL